jgi:serine O-acetyltransferase
MLKNFNADYQRYASKCLSGRERLYLIFEQGLWAIFFYRFSRWAKSIKIPVVGFLIRFLAFLFFKLSEMIAGVSLPMSADIGQGFYVGHFGPVIIHSDAKIGENCAVGPGVVIGTRGAGSKGVPRLGNNVYVGVGAKILGDIIIGDNVKIGANSVVLKNVPDNATVVGIPARIILKTNNAIESNESC